MWLKNTRLATTGNTFTIKPVILFPNWYVEMIEKGKRSDALGLKSQGIASIY